MSRTPRIAPSVLSADLGRLKEQVAEAKAGGAEWLHVDVMDGRFVPNLTFGAPLIKALRKVSDLPLDVHLMVVEHVLHCRQRGGGIERHPRRRAELADARELPLQVR